MILHRFQLNKRHYLSQTHAYLPWKFGEPSCETVDFYRDRTDGRTDGQTDIQTKSFIYKEDYQHDNCIKNFKIPYLSIYIKLFVCMSVCPFDPYRNPQFCTELHQIFRKGRRGSGTGNGAYLVEIGAKLLILWQKNCFFALNFKWLCM